MPHTPSCRRVLGLGFIPVQASALASTLASIIMGGLLLFPGLLCAAETVFWPVSGHLRDSPALMNSALHADGTAGNMVIVQADVPGDVAGAVVSQPPLKKNAGQKGQKDTAASSATASSVAASSATPNAPSQSSVQASTRASAQASTRRNTVIVQRGVVHGYADGGWNDLGAAQDNILIVSGGTVRKGARGGSSKGGPAEGNVLHMTGGSVENSAYGGSSLHDRASGNVLTFSGGEVRHAVVGGSSKFGQALGNAVRMGGGRVTTVLGGSSGHSDALGNTVSVLGGVVLGDIVGGETMDGELATQNTVSIGSEAQLERGVRIFGGLRAGAGRALNPAPKPAPHQPNTPAAAAAAAAAPAAPTAPSAPKLAPDQRKGNVLHMLGWRGQLRGVHNFQYVHFSLPRSIKAGDVVLQVDEDVDLHDAVLRLTGALPAGLTAGDSVILLRAPALRVTGLSLPGGTLSGSPADSLPAGSAANNKQQPTATAFTLSLDNAAQPTAIIMTLKRQTE